MNNIHPTAAIDETAKLGDNITIGPHCYIGPCVELGDECILNASVTIVGDTTIGKKNVFYPGCVIGQNPQMLGAGQGIKFGTTEIGNGNTIREHVTIHPSIYPDAVTKIGDNNLIMIGVHIGHDCVIENYTVLSNNSQISGHCKIETGVWLSGSVMVHQFVTIGKWSYAAGLSGLNHDVPPFVIVSGHYPPEVRSINKRGIARCGLDEQQGKIIFRTFKKLFRNDKPILENAQAIAAESDVNENALLMAQAIIDSSKHRYGRYLESLRRH